MFPCAFITEGTQYGNSQPFYAPAATTVTYASSPGQAVYTYAPASSQYTQAPPGSGSGSVSGREEGKPHTLYLNQTRASLAPLPPHSQGK